MKVRPVSEEQPVQSTKSSGQRTRKVWPNLDKRTGFVAVIGLSSKARQAPNGEFRHASLQYAGRGARSVPSSPGSCRPSRENICVPQRRRLVPGPVSARRPAQETLEARVLQPEAELGQAQRQRGAEVGNQVGRQHRRRLQRQRQAAQQPTTDRGPATRPGAPGRRAPGNGPRARPARAAGSRSARRKRPSSSQAPRLEARPRPTAPSLRLSPASPEPPQPAEKPRRPPAGPTRLISAKPASAEKHQPQGGDPGRRAVSRSA